MIGNIQKGDYGMVKVESLFVFIVIRPGEQESIMCWPDVNGKLVPLIYLSHEAVMKDNMKPAVKELAEQNGMFCEMREYKLVPLSEEKFYPIPTEYRA